MSPSVWVWGESAAVGGLAVAVAVALWLVWRARQGERRAVAADRQVAAVLEQADCLLWEARMRRQGSGWAWEGKMQPSALARDLFGATLPSGTACFWAAEEVPDRSEMDARCQATLNAGGAGYTQEFRLIRGGRTRWLRESVMITRVSEQEARMVGLVTEITAQRDAEQARQRSDHRLLQLLTQADCLLWQARVKPDGAGGLTWSEWFVPRSELYRRLVDDDGTGRAELQWTRAAVPEYDEIDARCREALRSGRSGYEQEFRVIRGTGVVWVREQVAIRTHAEGGWSLEGVLIDITHERVAEEARRVSEAQVGQIVETADLMLWHARVFPVEGGYLRWTLTVPRSNLYRTVFGEDPAERNPEMPWHRVVTDECRREMDERAAHALRTGARSYEQVFRAQVGGQAVWLQEQVTIRHVAPQERQLVGLITDVTARQEAEAARQASERTLEEIMTRADCLLWRAVVERDGEGVRWLNFDMPKSRLHDALFGENPQRQGGKLWSLIEVPELSALNARSRAMILNQAPGYAQEFEARREGRRFWLNEQVTIRAEGPDRWHLVGVITDVTLRHEAEEARRASEAQVASILATVDCLLWQAEVVDGGEGEAEMQWRLFIPPSRLFRELFGREPADYPFLHWPHVVDEATNAEINRRSREAMLGGASGYEQEFRAQRDGRVFWLHEQVAIQPAGPGRWRLVGVITDLTARREAEEARRASDRSLRHVLTHADCLLWRCTVRRVGDDFEWIGFELPASRLYRELFRDLPEEMQQRFWTWLDVPELPEMHRRARAALQAGAPGYEQVLHTDRGGRLYWLQERVSIERVGADEWRLVGVVIDITAQRLAEAAHAAERERLAVTLRAMAEGVITTDVAGSIQFMNAAAEQFTAWTAAGAANRKVEEVCRLEHDRTGETIAVPVASVVAGDSVADLPAQTRLVARDGAQRLVDGCCAPIHAVGREVTGAVLVLRDVTEHMRLEQELVRATRLESVGILAGGIAHDFNNILTAVMGNLALALLDVDPATEAGQSLRSAEAAALRARDLTQQLLTFAKGGEPVRAAVQLAGVVREMTAFALHGSRVKADFDLPAELWPADVDKGQIGRVVQNLVINAVQAMPEGGTVRVEARNDAVGAGRPGLKPGDYVRFAIADTGIGIKPEHLARIFDPYFTTKQAGSGLGLAAVYSIVKKHGGHIDVKSRPGRGTTFRFWLPCATQPAPVEFEPAVVVAAPLRGRVLFMDDEESIRRMATLLLTRFGLEVHAVADGAQAVECFRAEQTAGRPFQLVMMDLTVPGGMGGREAIALIRRLDPRVKAIVSSGYSSDPVLANFRAHGFDGVVAKPYQLDEFARVLRDLLGASGAA